MVGPVPLTKEEFHTDSDAKKIIGLKNQKPASMSISWLMKSNSPYQYLCLDLIFPLLSYLLPF